MAKASLAQIAHDPTTRIGRALTLFEEHGDQIEQLSADVFAVPSQDGLNTYRVDYYNETCNCPNAEHHPDLNCKHVLCVGIYHARTFRCDYCGERHPKSERVEVGPEQESWSMGAREGDRFCRGCAGAHGVL